jgi:hypothetical protein
MSKRIPLPPIPPGVETLRQARTFIDPRRTYHLQLPDGTTVEEHGSTLIRTADLSARGHRTGTGSSWPRSSSG